MKPARILQALVLVAALILTSGEHVNRPARADPPATNRAGAFFADPKTSERTELAGSIDDINDPTWLNLEFEPRHVIRHRVAILPVENRTAEAEQAVKTPEVKTRLPGSHSAKKGEKPSVVAEIPVAGIEELLTSAILGTDRFYLVDRKAVDEAVAAQTAAGGDAGPNAARLGRALGAQYLVIATVNEWVPQVAKKGFAGGGISTKFLGGLGVEQASSLVRMTVRIVDASTGQIVASISPTGTRAKTKLGLGALGLSSRSLAGVGGSLDRNAPITQALLIAVNKAVYHVVDELAGRPWQGVVSGISDERIYVNAGSNIGMTVGTKLTVLSRGKEINDPDTGVSLGFETREIGVIEVVTVEERMSIAKVVSGCDGLKESDFVRAKPSATGSGT